MSAQTLAAYATVFTAGGVVVAAAWRWWTWRQEHGTVVTAEISLGLLTFDAHVVEAIMLSVHNGSMHAVRVTSVAIEINDGSRRIAIQPMAQPGATIPGVVASHDTGMTWFDKKELEQGGFDVFRPGRGRISVGGQARFIWTKPRRLMRRK